jgi:hypothetical protein
MRTGRLRLKRANGWFAAGLEIEQALFLLSDSAFRLFVWICLRANRSTGTLQTEHAQIARVLHKSPDEIGRDLEELTHLQVCRVAGDQIVIQDRFWPYERACTDMETAQPAYVSAIKRAFLRHACVRSSFTAADEKLARDWQQRGISHQLIEHAILLGVARKYTALLNGGAATPITALEYFAGIIAELDKAPANETYCTYLKRKVQMLEAEYRKRPSVALTAVEETK